jgi:allophanate hydrolase
VTIDYTPFRQAAELLYSGPWVAERLAAIAGFLNTNADAVHPTVRKIIEGGRRYSSVDTFEAMYQLAALRRATEDQWERMDLLLLPTTGTTYTIAEVEANPVELNTSLGTYTNFVNLLDLAAVAVPAGRRPNGLPFGVSLIGPAFSEPALLRLAERLENNNGGALLTTGCVHVAVVGAHLTGQPLNHQLTSRGARLVETCRTAADYRLFSLRNTTPPKPGLLKEPGFAGPGIEIEIWAVPENHFGSFVAEIPPPLGIGSVTTNRGDSVKCFICEPYALAGALDITEHGGWRAWRASLG